MALAVATVLIGVAFPRQLAAMGPALLAVAVVVGLPHGAADHLAPVWSGIRLGRAPFVALLAGYAAIAVAALGAVLARPGVALALLALAAIHFGCGEVAVAAWRSGIAPSRTRAASTVAAVGATVVATPKARHPEVADAVLAALHPTLPGALPASAWSALLVGGVVAGGIAVVLALAEGDRLAAVELPLVLTVLVVTPPLAAFAVFFGGWHAWRHTVRLLDEDGRNADVIAAGDLRPALARFAGAAAPTTVVAGAGLCGLVLLGHSGAPSLAIALLLALTVPHAVVVGWMDVRLARRLR